MSQIYPSSSYDLQTLQIGMRLVPVSKEDALRILNNLSELEISHAECIRKILLFQSHIGNLNDLLTVKNELIEMDDYYSRIILNCIDFIYEDCDSLL